MNKFRGSVRDWIIAAREAGLSLDEFGSDKKTDTEKLQRLGDMIPVYQFISCGYGDFNERNPELMRFFGKHTGFLARAIPKPGRKDLTRKPEKGLLNFEECRAFLETAVRDHERDYNVVLSEWEPELYGGIIVAGSEKGRFVLGEIARDLLYLAFQQEDPLESFRLDRARIGHIDDKTTWYQENSPAREYLWEAFNYLRMKDDGFDPIFMRGYFEFIVTQRRKIFFVDFKDNPSYLA